MESTLPTFRSFKVFEKAREKSAKLFNLSSEAFELAVLEPRQEKLASGFVKRRATSLVAAQCLDLRKGQPKRDEL